ncbi:MAG: bifunctional 5,10-methylenetetrahydrofolate dehydrogenase/5,10-methenyltetrahydrofolate cyclohydrolase [Phycisphaerae bacterium]
MAAKIIDGESIAKAMNERTAAEVEELKKAGKPPHLVAIQVGENPASKMYTNMQKKNCGSVGIIYDLLNLPENISQDQLLIKIAELNASRQVTGMILQMPLPPHLDARKVQVALSPAKDVEGMHPENMGRLFYGGGIVSPCTPMAAVTLLKETCPDIAGKEAVVVGHSEIVGKPIAAILLQSLNASPTLTVCHVATKDLAFHTRRAEILFVATGVSQARWLGYQRRKKEALEKGTAVPPPPALKPLVSADMLREGAIVIDVAINRIPKALDANGEPVKDDKGKPATITVGDVDYAGALEKVAAITPVPGGVGPVTVAMLLRNTIACAKAM